MRRSKPGSHGSIRVNINGLPHLEQGGRSLSTNVKLRGSTIVRLSERLCDRNSQSIPHSEAGVTSRSLCRWDAANLPLNNRCTLGVDGNDTGNGAANCSNVRGLRVRVAEVGASIEPAAKGLSSAPAAESRLSLGCWASKAPGSSF